MSQKRGDSIRSRRIAGLILPSLLFTLLGGACTESHDETEGRTAPRPETSRVAADPCAPAADSLERSVGFLGGIDPSQPGDVFVALQLAELHPNAGLERFIQRGRQLHQDHPSAWYMIPGLPRKRLPETLPRGVSRFILVMDTPHSDPKESATELLAGFLLEDHDGYLLSHQTVVLEAAKAEGMALPDDVVCRGDLFLDRMTREQQRISIFSDLYAERAMLVLRYSTPPRTEADPWVKVILEAQRLDGSWRDNATYAISYDGGRVRVQPPVTHTTVLAALALAHYLEHYCEPSIR
jgi:hypothetical protein